MRRSLSYSDPIEYIYDGLTFPNSMVWQVQVGRDLRHVRGGASLPVSDWQASVVNSLRQSASIIVVGEARDPQTIRVCAEASMTGGLLYTTLHAGTVVSTISRASLSFRREEQCPMARVPLDQTRLIVTQRLLATPSGGRVAAREFIRITPNFQHDIGRRWS